MINRKYLWVVLPYIALIWLSANYSRKPSADAMQTRSQPPLLVRGYIASSVVTDLEPGTSKGRAHDVFLPGVQVFLKDLLNGDETKPVTTDLSGRFTLRAPRASRYRVCWKAPGFVNDCSKDIFSVGNRSLHIGTLRIDVERRNDTTVIAGLVKMKDGSSPRMLSPIANVNAFARVSLLDNGNNTLQQVYVNNFDEYLLPQVPNKQPITLRAQLEAAINDQLILRRANLDGAPFHAINLSIGNTPPRLEPIVPGDSAAKRVKIATPGSTVRLAARGSDADGDKLKFKWLVSDGSGSISAPKAPQTTWTLPAVPGRYSITLLASDGKGGYAQSSLSLRADEGRGIPFSGVVSSTFGPPVNGAEVEINGQLAITDATGFFLVRVRDAARFVFNVRKAGFALVSRIYDNGVTGGHWTMTRATVATIDPTKPAKVANERQRGDCPGPQADQFDQRTKNLRNAQWQDGKGNVIAPGRLDYPSPPPKPSGVNNPCGPGIQVSIPANSLVDERGRVPTGNVDIAVSTVDLRSPEQMPGDYTIVRPNGSTRVMESYGAGSIEITGGGHRYNLKPGATATVTIPIDPSQLAAGGSIPPTIPILFYNERTGVWATEGSEATRQGNNYVAVVSHFSTINTDLVKTNQSCVEVLSPLLPAFYDLEVTIPLGGGAAPRVITRTIDNSAPSDHVLYNLPSNTNIVLVPIDTSTTPHTPIGTFVVNTGGPQNPTSPNLPALVPGQGYIACSSRVTLTYLTVPDVPLFGEFLHGLYSFDATNLDELDPSDTTQAALKAALDTASGNYYQQIDPRGKRLTLADFKLANGFPSGEIHAIYANSGDLGFGRDMHCLKKLATDGLNDVAAYVTNYGDINTPDSQDAADAVTGSNPVATVAMEYSRIENPTGAEFDGTNTDRVVKFYVYNAAGTQLLRSANLDGLGARPVPQLCMVCHGGEYPGGSVVGAAPGFNNRDDVKLQSRFLPFDLHFYTFAPAPNDKATQQPLFKQLNEDIVKNTPPDPVIAEIINKMYAGGPTQDENFVVPGWNANAGQQAMYREVVARTCRTCHAANLFSDIKFDQASQFILVPSGRLGVAETRVCVQHVMPHAKRTHEIFWQSVGPHMPAQFEAFGVANPVNGWQGDKCGQFTGGGVTPPSLYSTTVQPIFDVNCIACHIGSSPPVGLNLAAGISFGALVNVSSTELASMKRVKPNDVANSYLVHKVEGTQGTVGGSGVRMPFGCSGASCLSVAQVNVIKTWINAGAPPP